MNFKDIKIIAEVASNHAGDISLAKRFIQEAAGCGVDYVKFQSSRYEDLVRKDDPQAEWIKKSSLKDEDHRVLIDECRKNGVKFLTTCFSVARVDFLSSLGMDEIKVASPDLLSFSMIEKLASRFRHLIISTGMHTMKELRQAIAFLGKNSISATLLHTISLYPASPDKAFMRRFLWLKDNYPRVGFSNHIPGTEAIRFAMCHGAEIIESHFKLGPEGPGRASLWDILPEDFRSIVRFRGELEAMAGPEEAVTDESFLISEESAAKKRFIGRWGDNR